MATAPVNLKKCCRKEIIDWLRNFYVSIGPAADRDFMMKVLREDIKRLEELLKDNK